jgi:hypothetical protein
VCQKRPDVDVPGGVLLNFRSCVVNDGDKAISVLSEIKNHVSIDIIDIRKHAANFQKVVPSNGFHDRRPGFDFVCGIRIAIDRFLQMSSGNDVHSHNNTSQNVKYQETVPRSKKIGNQQCRLSYSTGYNELRSDCGKIKFSKSV